MSAMGAYLKRLREGRGLTQEDVAMALGVASRNIGRWENGKNEPSAEVLFKLLNILRASGDDVQRIYAANQDEHEAVLLAEERLTYQPGKITIRPNVVIDQH